MKIPLAFKQLCEFFYQGIERDIPNPEDWIPHAVSSLNSGQKIEVHKYLNQAIAENTGTELQQIWKQSCYNYSISDTDELRLFLSMIRDACSTP